ncbi:MAG: type 1 glutamine amidotransferase domain-containing protein [Pseudomonadota bacterium]
MATSKKILIVLTSHDRLGDTGKKTGFWLEELAAPYYVFKDEGAELTLASPAGGQPPLDPKSSSEDAQTDDTRRFEDDAEAMEALANTVSLSEVTAEHFDAVFYPGGHGPLWDLVDDKTSIELIKAFWNAGKPVSAVCHAPIVLANVTMDNGAHLLKGKAVTGFTNGEEEAVGLTEVVPMLVEDTMKDRGARYTKGEDFAPFSVTDGRLITGQNPASSRAVAQSVLEALG